jgi:hypothetical protein
LEHYISVARRPAATEALYLFARYVFDELGYRRLVRRHHTANGAGREATARLGFVFEGIHRQVGLVKGANKDSAVYSIVNDGGEEWPLAKAALEAWLREENFGGEGVQKRRLAEIRDELKLGKGLEGPVGE